PPLPPLFTYTTLFRSYRDAHPEVRIELREMNSIDMEPALRARQVDVAVMRPHPVPADIETRIVFEEPLCVAVRRDHALAGRRQVDRKSTRLNSSHVKS